MFARIGAKFPSVGSLANLAALRQIVTYFLQASCFFPRNAVQPGWETVTESWLAMKTIC
jgi:hypothetical protein